eukprot:CAMPEP_0175149574 /NCGR_PEP_ID=MMETSP0087-20121206/17324_1 /TAXON_ID=136419 /ORGANISM="Unknown Unknown, Strain D1" /LENGTH=605 /DNA_ID=CAMNT_0016435291 /DNA_START=16 /DNA_END=1836 /DNA_ORIENTATION=+
MEVDQEVQVSEEPKQFRLEITQECKIAQSQNGLRHGDYGRYRSYCARRLRRIRKSLNFVHPRNKFVKRELTPDVINDKRYLGIPLMDAERAWSYAIELKNNFTEDTPRKRFHSIKRFAKAAKHSDELEKLCTQVADPHTQLEAEAYSSWMNANLLLEADKHQEAHAKFTHAKMLYDQLGKIGGVNQQALCEEKVEAMEKPLRYCNYILQRQGGQVSTQGLLDMQSGQMDALLKSKLQHVLQETRTRQAETLESVRWRGRDVPLKNAKIRVALITAQDLQTQIQDQEKSAAPMDTAADSLQPAESGDGGARDLFGELFSAYDEALSIVRSDIREAQAAKKTGSADPRTLEQLQALQAYLKYHKLRFTTDRNVRHAKFLEATYQQQQTDSSSSSSSSSGSGQKLVKPDDLCSMYDRLLDNVTEQIDLGVTEDDGQLLQSLQADQATYKAFRAFYLGQAFGRFEKHNEAVALFRRAEERCTTAIALNPSRKQELQALASKVSSQASVMQAKAYLETQELKAVVTNKMKSVSLEQKQAEQASSLIDQLDAYKACKQIVPFPPDFQATPAKPVLFDLAYNAVEYPDIEGRLPKEGWLGGAAKSLGGWFGR